MLHWKERRERAAFLALANGAIFRGWSFGAPVDTVGEAVFNTGMSGYQEIVTDPSYAGQFVTLTAPEIGNYGCNPQDEESRGLFLNGLVIHELNEPSNFRSETPAFAQASEISASLPRTIARLTTLFSTALFAATTTRGSCPSGRTMTFGFFRARSIRVFRIDISTTPLFQLYYHSGGGERRNALSRNRLPLSESEGRDGVFRDHQLFIGRLSSVEITPALPKHSLLRASSSFTPSTSIWEVIRLRIGTEYSPTPPVKTSASTPPSST